MEATSREKVEGITALIRIIVPFAPDDAKTLFTHAHEAPDRVSNIRGLPWHGCE